MSGCVGLELFDDSPGSLPHEHLTVWPFISVLWVDTIACVAASFVLNLTTKKERRIISKDVAIIHTFAYLQANADYKMTASV